MRTAQQVALLALCLGGAQVGCAPTTVRSGLPPANAASEHHEKWHAAFLFGALEASGPYALARLCPEGWSEISVGPDPFTLLAGALTLFVYAPTRVTVICAARGEKPAEGRAASSPSPPSLESF